MNTKLKPHFEAVLNSYSAIFFSNNPLLAALVVLVTFFNPGAGASGLLAVIFALAISHFTGLNKYLIQTGIYSYNALLLGIGMGTFYEMGTAFFLLFFVAVLFTVILSAVLQRRLGALGLPFLSIPFVLSLWLILLVSKEFTAIDLSTRNIYWINEMYAIGDTQLVHFVLFMETMELPPLMSAFFRALSSLFFQNNILAGMILSIGILLHSRILFSLLVIGFLTAYGFNSAVYTGAGSINYYVMGGNFMMISVAIGGFFVIPSAYSYVWAVVGVLITFLIVIGFGKIMGLLLLPVYSLPFCFTALCLLYFFMLKEQKGRVVITPIQLYSPEKNLYNHLSITERLNNEKYIRFQLPFLGQWMVSQGYDGNITHKGDWNKALDFIIVNEELKTYSTNAAKPEDFYCYNKPILAPANGIVQEIVDYLDDNEIGKIDQQRNWGNSIVLKHAEGLYTKMSHLKKNSFRVKIGDYVKQGDWLASCGNSGRSPEPHLHFQVQYTPYIGSKTSAYPIAGFLAKKGTGQSEFFEFSIPQETDVVSNLDTNSALKAAFDFLPGARFTVEAEGVETGDCEVFTDAYNQSYLYCHRSKATAYFAKNEVSFYFKSFYGRRDSLLFCFYEACYKIIFTTNPDIRVSDQFPLLLSKNGLLKWVQDVVSPFYIFSRLFYESENFTSGNDFFDENITINSRQITQFLTTRKLISKSTVQIKDNKITSFTMVRNHKTIEATCLQKG